jgi:hypothetical protein
VPLTPRSITFCRLPITPQWSAPNASEYPRITHSKLITPIATKDWTIVAITFFAPTRPP